MTSTGGPPPHPGPVEVGAPADLDLAVLHAQHWLPLVRLAALLLEDRALAEDVVQDAFLALHRAQLHDAGAAPGYLRTAVVNGTRTAVRRRQVARRHAPKLYSADVPAVDDAVLVDEEHRAVLAALRALTARRRETLILRFWSGLSDDEIAAAMGTSPSGVRSAASRGLAALKTTMEAQR